LLISYGILFCFLSKEDFQAEINFCLSFLQAKNYFSRPHYRWGKVLRSLYIPRLAAKAWQGFIRSPNVPPTVMLSAI
jgi:hypothetical protein